MSSSTLSPELMRDLNADQIDATLRDAEFWDYATAQFSDLSDLQHDKVQELTKSKEDLLEILMLRPGDAFMQEATYLAATCYAERMVEGTTFFTRSSTGFDLDSITKIYDSEDGLTTVIRHSMVAPKTYGYDHPVEIVATTDGDFAIYTQVYKDGITKWLEITQDQVAHEIMEEYFSSSLRAANAVQSRSPEANALADIDARERYARLRAPEGGYGF